MGRNMNELTTTTSTAELTARGFNSSYFANAWNVWIKDRADTTQNGYNVTVKCFLEWIVNNGITAPKREDIVSYRQWLLTPHASRKTGKEISFSADTAARYFRGCKMFFAFLEDQGLYKDITKNVRSPKTKIREFKRDSLEREDVLRILKSIDTSTETGKRDYALLLACVSCGFRIIELQRADIGDIETHAGERRLYIRGKGHLEKDDYKKIEPELWEALDDYLTTRGTKDKEAPLFAAVASNAKPGGGRLTEPSISRIMKGVLKKAGYDSRRITAHSLRHTSVTLDRKAGASLEEASKHARHSSINITQRYDHALEKAEAKDERRIMDYLFKGNTKKDESAQAAELMARIPASKRAKALELLEAFTS
jgi:integrase/recombinase XerC